MGLPAQVIPQSSTLSSTRIPETMELLQNIPKKKKNLTCFCLAVWYLVLQFSLHWRFLFAILWQRWKRSGSPKGRVRNFRTRYKSNKDRMQQYKNIFFNTAAEVWTLKMDLEMYCFLTACYSDWNLQGVILQSVQKCVEDNGHHHIVLHERWSEQLSSYCTLKGAAFDAARLTQWSHAGQCDFMMWMEMSFMMQYLYR